MSGFDTVGLEDMQVFCGIPLFCFLIATFLNVINNAMNVGYNYCCRTNTHNKSFFVTFLFSFLIMLSLYPT